MRLDSAAQVKFLLNNFGATKGANAPASHVLHLFGSDGTQLTTGYTPPTITNNGTSWPAPTNPPLVGATVTITYTATLTQPATHWALLGSDGYWWGGGEVPEGPWSGGSGTSDAFQPTLSLSLGAF